MSVQNLRLLFSEFSHDRQRGGFPGDTGDMACVEGELSDGWAMPTQHCKCSCSEHMQGAPGMQCLRVFKSQLRLCRPPLRKNLEGDPRAFPGCSSGPPTTVPPHTPPTFPNQAQQERCAKPNCSPRQETLPSSRMTKEFQELTCSPGWNALKVSRPAALSPRPSVLGRPSRCRIES